MADPEALSDPAIRKDSVKAENKSSFSLPYFFLRYNFIDYFTERERDSVRNIDEGETLIRHCVPVAHIPLGMCMQ